MADDAASPACDAREAATFAALLEAARRRQQAAQARSPDPPRFLLEAGRSMAAHMGMSEGRMQDCLGPMALWQLYLPSALGAALWDFDAVREHMPRSHERVRAALAAVESRPQVVCAIFHMAAFPLLATLIGAAWRELHQGPLHLLVASRNRAWLRLEDNRWVGDTAEVLDTDPAGLRRLVDGLKTGAVRRLLILTDGPQAPGRPGTRALERVSPALGVRTGLLERIHRFGIPLLPITHEWDAGRLVVTPHPVLEPSALSASESIDAVVRHIEDLLHRHPEQWLNWSAARIRT